MDKNRESETILLTNRHVVALPTIIILMYQVVCMLQHKPKAVISKFSKLKIEKYALT
jgi:hypothetical protein